MATFYVMPCGCAAVTSNILDAMSETAALAQRLVAIDSINPDLVPGGNGEAEIAAFIAEWAMERGLRVELVEPAPGRPSVVATARGTGGGRSLMLNAHMDTVGVAGMADPFAARIEEGRLHGRGAFDMKGSLAACMAATAELAGRGLAGDVILVAVADEEVASIGARAVVERRRADAVIVTEPTGGDVCVAHKGFVWLQVEVKGRSAHGSRPHLGVDAIAKTGRVLTGLEELDRTLRGGAGHPLLGTGSVHASLIEGGQEMSSYPERCVLGIERRTVPGETPEKAVGEIEAILARVRAQDPRFEATVEMTLARSSFEVDEAEPIVGEVRAAASAVEGRDVKVVGDSAWMDSAVFSDAGIPAVVIGPYGEGAHGAVEWVDVAGVERLREVLVRVAERFCA